MASLFIFWASIASANNLIVSGVRLVGKDEGNDTIDIQFDIAWDHSWRDPGAPSSIANWDATWLFAKYATFSAGTWSDWSHCTLLNSGSTAAAGATITFAETSSVYKGAFVYRSSSGSGSVNFLDNEFRWDYGADGIADTDKVRVQLFGVEMVYISESSFYLGDADQDQVNGFYEGLTSNPFHITSEGAISIGNTTGSLYYDADNANAGDQSGPVGANFPKGYAAFYVMKYEISQRQYTEFLNSLTVTQSANRVDGALHYNSYRNYIKKTSDGYYGVDANNNAGSATSATRSNLNEITDGEWIVCNYLSWMDLSAFADWAALRPMSELEFEKCARGPTAVEDDEYAWGSSTLESSTSALTDAAQVSEVPNQGNLNYVSVFPNGPFRTGSYADSTSTRTNAGSSFYGVMELSGNVWERVVTSGESSGRAFSASHGDGILTTTASYEGNATNTDWPGIDATPARGVTGATGSGFRGGSWNDTASTARIADRNNAAEISTTRDEAYGGRLVRSAP